MNWTLAYYAALALFILSIFPLDIKHIIMATAAYFLGTVSLAVRTRRLTMTALGAEDVK